MRYDAVMRWNLPSFLNPAASTDVSEEAWVEVQDAPVEEQPAWAPRGIFDRVRRWAQAAAIPIAVMSTSEAPAAIAPDAVVQVYETRTGRWVESIGVDVHAGDTIVQGERVLRMTTEGVEVRGTATVEDLAEPATLVAEEERRTPSGDDWVIVLGDADYAGHWLLDDVEAGKRFAFQGRLFDTADVDGDGRLEVRWSGDVLGKVVNTFARMAPDVIGAEIVYSEGQTETLTGTANHPFWVDAVRDYVPLGELEVGTVLHVQGGGEAILVSKTWRQGEFEVFDFEVEGLHNFYVRSEGSDAAGVLVHNSITNPVPSRLARIVSGDDVPGTPRTLGAPGADDVFVTAADDIASMGASEIAERLSIPEAKSFHVIEFDTPKSGLASPINRTNPGFTGGGTTAGGAREFVIPNGPLPPNSTTSVVQ